MSLHVVHYECSLSFVWGDDTDLLRSKTSIEKCWDYLLDVLSFFSIQEWCSRGWYFFVTNRMVEEHWLVRLRPREFETIKDAVLLWNSILERSFVESQRREITESWMHSVLDLESNRPYTKTDESLEKTLIQTCLWGFFTHDYWTKLTMVTYQYNVFGTLQNWNESLWFSCLGGFVDKNLFELEMLQPLVECTYASCANDVSIPKNFILCLSLQIFVYFIIFVIELAIDFSLLD